MNGSETTSVGVKLRSSNALIVMALLSSDLRVCGPILAVQSGDLPLAQKYDDKHREQAVTPGIEASLCSVWEREWSRM